jgi:putative flippase GtrA
MMISWMEFKRKHATKIRFIIVGVWNTIFGYAAYVCFNYIFSFLFTKRLWVYMTAAVLSNILAITNAYIFHKFITFKSPVRGLGIIFELCRFFTTYLFSFIIGLIILPILVEICHIDPIAAGAIQISFTAIISYVCHTRFSFKMKN